MKTKKRRLLAVDGDHRFLQWARAATAGVDNSSVFMGMLDDAASLDTPKAAAFTLQIGRALLTGKPIVILAPHGMVLPEKLQLAADEIIRYSEDRPEDIQNGLVAYFHRVGAKVT